LWQEKFATVLFCSWKFGWLRYLEQRVGLFDQTLILLHIFLITVALVLFLPYNYNGLLLG
jgi:hypothetical protein